MHFEVHGATTKESASGAAPVGRPRIKAVVVVVVQGVPEKTLL